MSPSPKSPNWPPNAPQIDPEARGHQEQEDLNSSEFRNMIWFCHKLILQSSLIETSRTEEVKLAIQNSL